MDEFSCYSWRQRLPHRIARDKLVDAKRAERIEHLAFAKHSFWWPIRQLARPALFRLQSNHWTSTEHNDHHVCDPHAHCRVGVRSW